MFSKHTAWSRCCRFGTQSIYNDLSNSLPRERFSGWFTGVLFESIRTKTLYYTFYLCVFRTLWDCTTFFSVDVPRPPSLLGHMRGGGSTPEIKLFSPLCRLVKVEPRSHILITWQNSSVMQPLFERTLYFKHLVSIKLTNAGRHFGFQKKKEKSPGDEER